MIKAENRYKNTNTLGVTMFTGKIFIQPRASKEDLTIV